MQLKKMKLNRKILKIPLIIIFLIILGVAVYRIFIWQDDSQKTKSKIEEIINETKPVDLESTDDSTLVNPPEDQNSLYWKYVNMSIIDVDLAKLKEQNSETKGWIQVPGTNINFPFVQHSDNEYYLYHSFNQEKNIAGWVYLDSRNSINPFDKNNIIYAHRRVLFYSLTNIFDSGWLNNPDNHVIKIYTDSGSSLWQVFSVYHTTTTSDYLVTDFANDPTYSNFLKYIEGKSAHNFNVEVDQNDKILTLSTCYTDTEKVVLHAKLIKYVEN